jgi:hypothetical protein
MGFETVVLTKVSDVLGTDNQASFAYGTLFVECTEAEARKVFHRLSKDFGLGKVQISKSERSPEFAFDFV